MRIIVIHAETGDTVAAVVRFEELDMMGLKYTEIPSDGTLSPLIKGNDDLKDDLDLLLCTCLNKESVGL